MKKLMIFLIVFLMLFAGCGVFGISQYEKILNEKRILEQENREIKEDNQKLIKENEKQKEEKENIKKQVINLTEEKELIEDEYKEYKENMKKYEAFFQYSDKIEDYNNLELEIGKKKDEKTRWENEIQKLQVKWKELQQKIEQAKKPNPESSFLVYSDKKVEIYFLKITSEGVVFEVKNKTDINLTFQADSIAINGISTNDIKMSDDIAPQSVGKIIARCSDFNVSEKVYTVSGQMRVVDFSGSWKSYDAKFVNAEAK